MQGESELTKRRTAERRSLAQLREDLQRKNNELIQEVEDFQEEFDGWSVGEKSKFERLYQTRRKLVQRQHRHQTHRFTKELNVWREKVSSLEATYEELLRLRKPAQYWSKSARKYGLQGLCFTALILIFVFGGLIYFESFFIAWLQGHEVGVQLNTIQGVVIFGSILAVYAFLVRVFSRLAFSSFHLMRDSEEREQLTYLYLSLAEETSVNDDARMIILQALFSRTETGLLAQEHGPSMPAAEAVRFIGKSRPQ